MATRAGGGKGTDNKCSMGMMPHSLDTLASTHIYSAPSCRTYHIGKLGALHPTVLLEQTFYMT
jgi:hypothetical protein